MTLDWKSLSTWATMTYMRNWVDELFIQLRLSEGYPGLWKNRSRFGRMCGVFLGWLIRENLNGRLHPYRLKDIKSSSAIVVCKVLGRGQLLILYEIQSSSAMFAPENLDWFSSPTTTLDKNSLPMLSTSEVHYNIRLARYTDPAFGLYLNFNLRRSIPISHNFDASKSAQLRS